MSFSIGRIGDEVEEVVGRLHSSAELVELADASELVLALDGTTVDEAEIPAAGAAAGGDAMQPSSVSTG